MDDSISRAEAIAVIRKNHYRLQGKGMTEEVLIADLEALPSAQPEPKSPVYYGDGYADGQMVYDSAECPTCGYIYERRDSIWGEPFCPHCGQAIDWEE